MRLLFLRVLCVSFLVAFGVSYPQELSEDGNALQKTGQVKSSQLRSASWKREKAALLTKIERLEREKAQLESRLSQNERPAAESAGTTTEHRALGGGGHGDTGGHNDTDDSKYRDEDGLVTCDVIDMKYGQHRSLFFDMEGTGKSILKSGWLLFRCRPLSILFTLIGVILYGMFLEFVVEFVSHHTGASYVNFILKVYTELMILGIIGFTLFFAEDTGASHYLPSGFDKHVFELCHILVFFQGIAYVFFNMCLILVINTKEWKLRSDEDQLRLETKKPEGPEGLRSEPLQRMRSSRRITLIAGQHFKASSLLENAFEGFRDYFYFQHRYLQLRGDKTRDDPKLPKEFSFTTYLRMCLRENVAELSDLSPTSWICLLSIPALAVCYVKIGSVDKLGAKFCFGYIMLAYIITWYMYGLSKEDDESVWSLLHEISQLRIRAAEVLNKHANFSVEGEQKKLFSSLLIATGSDITAGVAGAKDGRESRQRAWSVHGENTVDTAISFLAEISDEGKAAGHSFNSFMDDLRNSASATAIKSASDQSGRIQIVMLFISFYASIFTFILGPLLCWKLSYVVACFAVVFGFGPVIICLAILIPDTVTNSALLTSVMAPGADKENELEGFMERMEHKLQWADGNFSGSRRTSNAMKHMLSRHESGGIRATSVENPSRVDGPRRAERPSSSQ